MLPYRIRFLLGSQVVQLWVATEDPFVKELPTDGEHTKWGDMFKQFVKDSPHYKRVNSPDSIESFELIEDMPN